MSWIRNNKVIDNHKPVMLNNLIKIMQKDKRERFIDCTFGAGGHTSALMSLYPNMVFFALDRDPMTEDLIKTKNITGENFFFFCDRFSRINNYKTKIFDLEPNDFLEKKTSYQQGYFNESINNFEIKTNFKISEQENTIDYKKITIFFDLGMSNIQLFDSKRGFSYQNTLAELNLSMDEESKSVSDFLNNDTEYNIFKVLNDFGEEYFNCFCLSTSSGSGSY